VLEASTLGIAGYISFVALYAGSLGQHDARLEFALFAVVTLLVRTAGGRLLDRHRLEPLLHAALGLSATGLLLIALLRTPVGLLVGTVVFAVGQAPTFPALIALAAARAPAARRTAAVATLTTCFDLAYGVAAFALGALWQRAGFPALWLAAAAAALTGNVLLVVGPPTPPPRHPTSPLTQEEPHEPRRPPRRHLVLGPLCQAVPGPPCPHRHPAMDPGLDGPPLPGSRRARRPRTQPARRP
jgi:MFS family permease